MVGFRMFAVDHARRLGLRGWVRNLPRGDLEVLVQGDRPALAEFLALLRQGPPMAEVTSFAATEESAESELGEFQALP